MLLSLSWLRDYVALPPELTAETIARDLTMVTVEVEDVRHLAERFGRMVVTRVAEVRPHPTQPGLHVVNCTVANGDVVPVVTDQRGIEVGLDTALALTGAVLTGAEGRITTVAPRMFGTARSSGMLLAPEQVGLEDLFPAGRVMNVGELVSAPGTPLAAAVHFDDTVIEVDNKSLTNRPDLWGHYGIARELAAIYGLQLKPLPSAAMAQQPFGRAIRIHDAEACRRFTATLIRGVTPSLSPLWLRSRLVRVGQRPINLLVDLTNYVMLAVGQPCHAFDAAKLNGHVTVRRLTPGESFALLNGSVVRGDGDHLIDPLCVVDETGPVALAGIMGAERASVHPDTTTLVLEIANFEPIGIRRTATALGVRTESSVRFDKSLAPALVDEARGLFFTLLSTLSPASDVAGYVDVFPAPPKPIRIQVTPAFVEAKLGTGLGATRISQHLVRLGFEVRTSDDVLDISVPWWRATGDVSIPEDIVEEVGRLYGYAHLAPAHPTIQLTAPVRTARWNLELRLREYFARRGAMREVVTYPWVEAGLVEAAGLSDEPALVLVAPPAPNRTRLRTSLVPGLLEVAAANHRTFDQFGIFEVGRVFRPEMQPSPFDESEQLPSQPKHIAALQVGPIAEALFFRMKGLLEGLAREVQTQDLVLDRDAPGAAWADPRGRLSILHRGQVIGCMGCIAPRTARLARLRGVHCALFELCLDALEPLASRTNRYTAFSVHPQVDYDLSLIVLNTVTWAALRGRVADAHPLILDAAFVEEYRGRQVPVAHKSVTLRLRLGSGQRTLTSEDISAAADAAANAVEQSVGAAVRRRKGGP